MRRCSLANLSGSACQTLYFFSGDRCTIGGTELTNHAAVKVRADAAVQIVADGGGAVELLLLQGRPIGEPVVQHGPFVMSSKAEIMEAFVSTSIAAQAQALQQLCEQSGNS